MIYTLEEGSEFVTIYFGEKQIFSIPVWMDYEEVLRGMNVALIDMRENIKDIITDDAIYTYDLITLEEECVNCYASKDEQHDPSCIFRRLLEL